MCWSFIQTANYSIAQLIYTAWLQTAVVAVVAVAAVAVAVVAVAGYHHNCLTTKYTQ